MNLFKKKDYEKEINELNVKIAVLENDYVSLARQEVALFEVNESIKKLEGHEDGIRLVLEKLNNKQKEFTVLIDKLIKDIDILKIPPPPVSLDDIREDIVELKKIKPEDPQVNERINKSEETCRLLDNRISSLNHFMGSLEVSINERFTGFFNILERHIRPLLGTEVKTELINSLLRKVAKLEKDDE